MNLPIRFPSDAEVITEEVSRFRASRPRIACVPFAVCSQPARHDATVT